MEQVGLQWCGVAAVKQSDVGCSSLVQWGVEWSGMQQCSVEWIEVQCGVEGE